jgi:nucleoid DNA-binding protein
VTKKDLARAIATELNLSSIVTLQAVQMTLDGITQALVVDGRVELRNFGVFAVRKRRARKARNPRTGERVKVPAKLVVTFKPGREMEAQVGKSKKAPDGM